MPERLPALPLSHLLPAEHLSSEAALNAEDVRAAEMAIGRRLHSRTVLGHWDMLSVSPYEAAHLAVEALLAEGFRVARIDGSDG